MSYNQRLDVDEDLLAVTKFKNAKLFDAAQAVGGMRELAQATNISYGIALKLCGLSLSPWGKNGDRRAVAEKLAAFCGHGFEELFPPSLYALSLPKELHRTFHSDQLLPLLEATSVRVSSQLDESLDAKNLRNSISRCLLTLTPREEQVIKMRFGLDDGVEKTLDDVAKQGPLA